MAGSLNINKTISERTFTIIEYAVMVAFCILPLLVSFPFRVNIYLTWEGAYRMLHGEIPYKDFGSPIGPGFWLVPVIFFKLFGPYMYSLIMAQAFINLVSFLTIRSILKIFNVSKPVIIFSLLILGLTFVLINFWPWYNHTVFVFEIVGLYFLIKYLLESRRWYLIPVSAFFVVLAFFTKQDGGGLAFFVVLGILIYVSLIERQVRSVLLYLASFVIIMALFIAPFLQYDFTYWFNYGQPPHFSRINLYNFLQDIFQGSFWIKFYIVAVIAVAFLLYGNIKAIVSDKKFMIFALFTLGILFQAMIIQVTSFSPPTVNYYFHAFGVAFILYALSGKLAFEKLSVFVVSVLLLTVWRSENYWKYSMKILDKVLPSSFAPPPPDVVSKGNWAAKAETEEKHEPVQWVFTDFKTLKRIKLPLKTLEGIRKIQDLDLTKKKNFTCLNMSNLTFLRHELGYTSPKGQYQPLWFHLNVASFEREIGLLCSQIERGEYDLIIFEMMPDVDNFFPFDVRDCAKSYYEYSHTFPAPTGYGTDYVEVYIKP